MKTVILFLGLILGLNAFAATGSGQVSNITSIGGFNNNDNTTVGDSNSQGYFTIYTYNTAPTAGNVLVLKKNGSAYQVTAGKTFKMSKICYASSVADGDFQLLTATASFADNATTASLTGPVYQAGAAAGYFFHTSATANQIQCWSASYDFGASTYVGIQARTANSYYVAITGKEI